jgi:membrane associated rhomboid family serine protease
MTLYEHQGVKLDVCSGCHGLWFDLGELRKVVDTTVELARAHGAAPTGRCPRCAVGLKEKSVLEAEGLLLDEGGRCSGVFLDHGELQRIQQLKAARARRLREEDLALRREIAARQEEKRRSLESQADRGIEVDVNEQGFLPFLLGIPTEVDTSLERTPWAVYGLIVAISLTWIWQLGYGLEASVARFGEVPAEILAGQRLHTLLTSIFMHVGWLHLLGNLYYLWLFGDNVDDRMGSIPFLAWYAVWGLSGSLVSIALCQGDSCQLPHIGASGAISGALGAYMVLFPDRRIVDQFGWMMEIKMPAWIYLGGWVVLQIFGAMTSAGHVDMWAHAGGFVAGAVVAGGYRGLLTREAA